MPLTNRLRDVECLVAGVLSPNPLDLSPMVDFAAPNKVPQSISVGAGLHLEALCSADAMELFALIEHNRTRLRQWLPWLDANQTLSASQLFIEESLGKLKDGTAARFGMWMQGRLAGVIGLESISDETRSANIGYWIGAEFEGRGIVTASARSLCRVASTYFRLARVQIFVASQNTRSRAVAERLFFRPTETRPLGETLYGHHVDHIVYTLELEDSPSQPL